MVVGEPPKVLARAVPRPSAAMARPMDGSRSLPVISATALTWPVFSATRAITAGRTKRMKAHLNSGKCQPASWCAPLPVVLSGNPIHLADLTASKLARQCVVSWPAPAS
ncbi:MAG: hypothetical protein AUG49_03850 [Catenulispora sp. 13_1_20CM_3_70_7]|nr:MAG: hypothetical protein AUG49_03850 [Catenulispora sp. 13_1_20CM_3_70_7]